MEAHSLHAPETFFTLNSMSLKLKLHFLTSVSAALGLLKINPRLLDGQLTPVLCLSGIHVFCFAFTHTGKSLSKAAEELGSW